MDFILSKAAWQMDIIQPFSPTHFVILALIVVLLILTGKVFYKTKYNMARALFVLGILLVLMEVIKEVFLTYVRGWDYCWSGFPFQLCSMPMYLALLYPIFQKRKDSSKTGAKISGVVCRAMEGFFATFGMIGGAAALIEPMNIFWHYYLLTIHSLLWHVILLIMGLMILVEKRKQLRNAKKAMDSSNVCDSVKAEVERLTGLGKNWKERLRDYQAVGGLYLFLAICAILVNACLMKVSEGTANMFFLGPSFPDMYILNAIYTHAGWVLESIAYMAVTWGMGLLVYMIFSYILRRKL